MGKFLAIVATWLMVLVALGQGGPGGPGGPGGGGSPTLSPRFDLNDWMTNEPATDRFTFPNQLPAVEGNTVTVVYDKGGSAQVQLFFKNDNPQQAFVGQLIVEDARYIHDAAPLPVPWGTPPPVTIPDTILSAPTVSLNIASLATAPATLTISGLPAFVTKGHIQLQMRAEGNFGAQPAGGGLPSPWSGILSSQKVLITYAPPTGLMIPVWTEVAEMSCTMAQSQATIPDVNRELVKGLYFGNIFAYNLGTDGVPSIWINPTSRFKLSEFLMHGPSGNNGVPVAGNCFDVNTFLNLLHQSQGIDANGQISKLVINGQVGYEWVTNRFCPIGSDPTDMALHIRVIFVSHYQTIVQGNLSDSALGYLHDLNGATHQNPAWGWPNLPAWQTILGSNAYGVTFRRKLQGDTESVIPPFPFKQVTVGYSSPISEIRETTSYNVVGLL